MKSFLLIGAGDFGHLLARELSKQPCELMIADINEDALGDLLELGISAKIGDCSREEVLESFDVASFDACFVCVGGHFQTSLEIVYLLEKLHAKKIHCKADDDSQAKFLSIIGADHVIYPEYEMANWAAIRYSADNILDYIELPGDNSIFEFSVPAHWVGKTILEIDVRKNYHVNIIGLVRDGVLSVEFDPTTVLRKEDSIMVTGKDQNVFGVR